MVHQRRNGTQVPRINSQAGTTSTATLHVLSPVQCRCARRKRQSFSVCVCWLFPLHRELRRTTTEGCRGSEGKKFWFTLHCCVHGASHSAQTPVSFLLQENGTLCNLWDAKTPTPCPRCGEMGSGQPPESPPKAPRASASRAPLPPHPHSDHLPGYFKESSTRQNLTGTLMSEGLVLPAFHWSLVLRSFR